LRERLHGPLADAIGYRAGLRGRFDLTRLRTRRSHDVAGANPGEGGSPGEAECFVLSERHDLGSRYFIERDVFDLAHFVCATARLRLHPRVCASALWDAARHFAYVRAASRTRFTSDAASRRNRCSMYL
jgi:hypothetical protein